MQNLTDQDKQLWQFLEELEGVQSWLDFVPLMTPYYQAPSHLYPLASAFDKAANGQPVRIVSSTPPRHGKSESILHWMVKYLQKNPTHTIGYCTYAATLAESKSRTAMQIARRAGLELGDIRSGREWRLKEGGGVLATGVGGPLTGFGLNLGIIDDFCKNREEAESPVYRQKTEEWFTSTFMSRIEPGGSVIINAARWSQDDLIARVISNGEVKWDIVNLPAISDDGQPLWPDRWPMEALEERKKEVHEYDWNSLYLGRPRPKGGQLFREPARYRVPDIRDTRIVISCDPAATAKTTADYSAIVILAMKGIGANQVGCVLDVWRGQVEIPQLVSRLYELQKKHAAPVAIESVGGFKAVPQMMRSIAPDIKIIETSPASDKFTRALGVAAAWNDGRIKIPYDAPWVSDFLKEVCTFTGVADSHDDMVDALSQAFNVLDRRIDTNTRRGMVVPTPGLF